MVRRHKRRKSLTDFERERFAREAAEMHSRLIPHMIALSPLSDDYKAVARLSSAIQDAIREITGEDPEWCRVGPCRMPGAEK